MKATKTKTKKRAVKKSTKGFMKNITKRHMFSAKCLPLFIRKQFPDLKTVSDATESLIIEVGEKDVTDGIVKDPGNCALAAACIRQEKADAAIIRITSAYVIKGSHAIRYNVPVSVQREIVSFDRNKDFRPGVYHLARIAPCSKLGTKKPAKTGPKLEKANSQIKVFRHVTVGIRQ